MEKQRTGNRKKFCIGLLIFLCLMIEVYAQRKSALVIEQRDQYCFTDKECVFELFLSDYAPSQVDITVQSTSQDMVFVSYNKYEYVTADKRGTKVELVYRFDKSGIYRIPPVAARLKWNWTYITFKPVTVYDNPLLIIPEITVSVSQPLIVGKPCKLTVSTKFFKEIKNIKIDLSESFIVKDLISEFDFPYKQEHFSTDIKEFTLWELIPLVAGECTIPDITVSVQTYASNRINIKPDNLLVKIKENEIPDIVINDEKPFNKAFEVIETEFEQKEYDDLFNENLTFEEVLLQQKIKQKNCKILHISLFILILIIALFLILVIIKRKRFLTVVFILLEFVAIIGICISAVDLSKNLAVVKNCGMYNIPEEESGIIRMLSEGTVVRILNNTNEWYYVVDSKKTDGWIRRDYCTSVKTSEKD